MPRIELLLAFFVLMVVLFLFFEPKMLSFVVILTLTIMLSIKLLDLKFNLKRALFLSILVSLLSFLSLKISTSFAGSFFLLLAVMHFCSARGFIASGLFSSIPFLILEPDSIHFILISLILFRLYLATMNIKIVRLKLRDYVEAFIKFWLTSDPKFAERVLIEDSESFVSRARCLNIKNFKIISTDLHPGPFRNIGGAKLVEFLDSENLVYLHSPTSHERDPVSEEEIRKIKDSLSCDGEKIFPMTPFEVEGDRFKIFCIPFSKIRLIFVSGKERIDDFLLSSNNFVVDCHNANFFGELSEEERREIESLVRKVEEVVSSPEKEVKFSSVKIYCSTKSISRYVSAVMLEFSSGKYAIVVFDSNNVKREFRELVERRFSEIGFKAIVCSTDSHAKTGVRVRESYVPAGGCAEDYEVLEILLEKCKKAKFDVAEFKYFETKVEVRVLGKILEKLDNLAKIANRQIYLFFILVFLNFLLPLAKVI